MDAAQTRRVLLLNADYRPHAVLNWKEAITMLLQGKARPEKVYEDWSVRSPSITIQVPSVLVLLKYVVFRQTVNFSRANIYARDNQQCQYCGKKAGRHGKLSFEDLTFDHVLPRSRGGETSWENIVTACSKCNTRKANKTPKEARMTLLRKPVRPKKINKVEFSMSTTSVPAAWRDYLYWNQELDSSN